MKWGMKKNILIPLVALLAMIVAISVTVRKIAKRKEAVAVKEEVTTARGAFLPVKPVPPIKEKVVIPREEPKVFLPAIKPEEVFVEELLVADFDSCEKPNNIGGNFGAWDKDPADFSQGCAESFDSENRRGQKGFAMKLDYDVDSRNPAYNGFWMFLQNLDVSGYDNISFWVKGDPDEGYTTVFKVELKNVARQVGRYYITDVTDKWQKMVIPLKSFKGITDFSNLTEFVIVFEDRIASNRDGSIYIDDIEFTKSK
ncbi:MAG: carbohydrate binding domain-containing protein [Candidatus Omnitrophota bacterium]